MSASQRGIMREGGNMGRDPWVELEAITRRRFLARSLRFAGMLWIGHLLGGRLLGELNAQVPPERLTAFARNVVHGGPPKDGIPPIDNPKYVSAGEADKFLGPEDVVFGMDEKGTARAYPQIIMVWHEIVNEEISGEKLAVTYCPLTGSAIAYRGRSKVDGRPLTFGTSGNLVNSNLLMYDRQTDSRWPQILGVAITGPNLGQELEALPLTWTTWGRWKRRYPKTLVLSKETGYVRSYGYDPYGSYTSKRPSYYTSGGPFFPVMARSNRFPEKKVVVGVKVDHAVLALPKAEAASAGVVNFTLGGLPLVALYDKELDAVSVFARQHGGQELTFLRRGEEIVDAQTATTWSAGGRGMRGKLAGAQLKWVTSFDVMWFAWYAFYPETKVLVP
jgi:hypothetical protein